MFYFSITFAAYLKYINAKSPSSCTVLGNCAGKRAVFAVIYRGDFGVIYRGDFGVIYRDDFGDVFNADFRYSVLRSSPSSCPP